MSLHFPKQSRIPKYLSFPAAVLSAFLFSGCKEQVSAPPEPITARTGTSELTAEWWQWAMSTSEENSPLTDRTGKRCGVNQRGEVWFLAGGFGSAKVKRECSLPAGKKVFFPLVNMVHWRPEDSNDLTCDDVKAYAAMNNDSAMDLFAELNGKPIQDLKQFRLASKECFNVFARVPASAGAYNAFPSATDGFWVLLDPLPPGRHTLKFGGRYNNKSADFGRMAQDIEYVLTVQ